MKIPFVIDNQSHKLTHVLNELLGRYTDRSLDVASAFFSVNGFEIVREGLEKLDSFRLLVGLVGSLNQGRLIPTPTRMETHQTVHPVALNSV